MKIDFTLKELVIIYQGILKEKYELEKPIFNTYESMLQYNSENYELYKIKRLEELKDNKDYNDLIALKEKLEQMIITFNIDSPSLKYVFMCLRKTAERRHIQTFSKICQN